MSGKSVDRSIHWDDDGLREEHAGGRPETSSTYMGGDRVDVTNDGDEEGSFVPPPGYKWYLFEKAYPESEDEQERSRNDDDLGSVSRSPEIPRMPEELEAYSRSASRASTSHLRSASSQSRGNRSARREGSNEGGSGQDGRGDGEDPAEWKDDMDIDYDLVDNPYGYSRSPSATGEYYNEEQQYHDYEQQLQQEQEFGQAKAQDEKPRPNIPKPSRYKPRDTIVVGGDRELERPDNINRQTHAITKTAKVGRPTDNLRMEGNRDMTREQASAHFGPRPEKVREPRGNLKAEGQMDLERSGSINRIRHGQTARDKVARPNDQIRLEGEYTMRTGRDDHGRMQVSRTARAGAPAGALRIDKNDKLQTHTSRDDHVAFASARPGRAGPGKDNMNVKEGDMDFQSMTRDTYRQAHDGGARPERVRKAKDNMKVGEGELDTESVNKSSYKTIKATDDELRAKPDWYKKPKETMTVFGTRA